MYNKIKNMIKLVNLLRENDGEEEKEKREFKKYDLILKPESIDKAIDALSNIENYGPYAQSMRDPELIKKTFGPSIPAQKAGAAWKDWDERNNKEKKSKIKDIQSRVPNVLEISEKEASKQFEQWKQENEGDFTDYLISLPGKQLPKEFYGKFGKNYFPIKTPENLKKYGNVLKQNENYVVEDDIISFPPNVFNPFQSKSYLEKVLTTIMNNADIKFTISQVERDEDEKLTQKEKPKSSKSTEGVKLTTTLDDISDARDLRKQIQSKFIIPTMKFDIEETDDNVKLIITGITPYQRAKLQQLTVSFMNNLMESKNRMLKIAGVVNEDEFKIDNFIKKFKKANNGLRELMRKEGI